MHCQNSTDLFLIIFTPKIQELDSSYPLRLCASSFLSSTSSDKSLRASVSSLLSKIKGAKGSKDLEKKWAKVQKDEDGKLDADEKCPACRAVVFLNGKSLRIAVCSNNHIWGE